MTGLVDPAGPLVVTGGRWGLPTGHRGEVAATVAGTAAGMGVPVVLVLGEPPANLWDEDTHTAEAIGGEGAAAWRYRVTVPGATKPVTLVLVDRDGGGQAGPWAGLSGTEVCAALRVLAALLDITWGHSVGRTAEHLILSTHPTRRGGRKLDRNPDVPDVIRPARVEQPWSAWSRPLTPYESDAAYVHTFDANAAYLGPWQSVELGFGKPTHYATSAGCARHCSRPGVWRVELPTGWDDGGLPPIAPGLTAAGADDRGKAGWVTTPTLHRLSEWSTQHGWGEVVPVEGWAWPEQSRFLRGAGERLRDARTAAARTEADALASLAGAETVQEVEGAAARAVTAGVVREAVGALYRVLVGRLSSEGAYVSSGWARPDWGNAIRAAYRVGLHRKIARWQAAPFAIATDALAFATDEPDPLAFAASIGLQVGDGLGQFKHQGTCRRELVDPHHAAGRRGVGDVFAVAAGKSPRRRAVPA